MKNRKIVLIINGLGGFCKQNKKRICNLIKSKMVLDCFI